jgi:hypothetical protein
MTISEILIRESSNLLLLILVVIGLAMLVRWFHGRAVFTERDWLLYSTIQERGLSASPETLDLRRSDSPYGSRILQKQDWILPVSKTTLSFSFVSNIELRFS